MAEQRSRSVGLARCLQTLLAFLLVGTAARSSAVASIDLVPADGHSYAQFGYSVALNGNTALIGAEYDNGTPSVINAGAAYIYNAATGQQGLKLVASDRAFSDGFGHSVAFSGNTAIVGAPFSNPLGSRSGSAYLFDMSTGQQLFKLTGSDENAQQWFGVSVAISGNLALVGGPRRTNGGAYLFDVTTGLELRKLLPTVPEPPSEFGQSVALDGNKAAVGARFGAGQHGGKGTAYVFDATTGQQLLKLTPTYVANDPSWQYDQFGTSIAMRNNRVLVGAAPFMDSSSGAAYLFDATTGQQLFKFLSPELPNRFANFGSSVAISGNVALVGSLIESAAYAFDMTTGTLLAKLAPDVHETFDMFGSSVAISGNLAIVGAPYRQNYSGAAYVFGIPEPASGCLIVLGCAAIVSAARTRRK